MKRIPKGTCRVCGKPITKRLDVGLCYRHRFDS